MITDHTLCLDILRFQLIKIGVHKTVLRGQREDQVKKGQRLLIKEATTLGSRPVETGRQIYAEVIGTNWVNAKSGEREIQLAKVKIITQIEKGKTNGKGK